MGLNDPQWGRKKGNSGPPDLDQLWRNFNKKLNSLFKRKGGGGTGQAAARDPVAPTPRQYGGASACLSDCSCSMDIEWILYRQRRPARHCAAFWKIC